ncbi:DUF5752 family protein [Desulfobacca acetoxidans]|uniref:Uncharacterized protein n=1 Tax=Desulfobacca acetoxidans (strain ATCC 700848 / DSM 11109 / ASRB2) TaxID=880072 RepID=F2NF36_DESAR|nr:DUF5752 family protein [Desulfobacca acetoxidans]AEB08376.1 hypothetical protein Desac_0490 [Desulfobacca acetoxidans DSM 11109]
MNDIFNQPAHDPFWFRDCFLLRMPIGLKASNLRELLQILRDVSEDVLYYHVFQARLALTDPEVEYPNDFALWAAEALQDTKLAEKLSSFDPFDYSDMAQVREAVLEILEEYLWDLPYIPWARPGFELYLCQASTAIIQSLTPVNTLTEFCQGLQRIGLDSFYYHFFEARWRLKVHKVDDFSFWIEYNFDLPKLVQAIRDIDIYFYSLPELRRTLLALITEHLEAACERTE